MFFLGAKRTKNARHTGFTSHSLLGSEILRIFLVRRSLVACVCRSNLGNKRTRFTHSQHRMAHTLRHICSYSSIGTDTRCCSNGAGFLFDITFCRWIARIAKTVLRFCHLDQMGEISKSMQRCLTYVRHDTASGYASRSNPLNDGTV